MERKANFVSVKPDARLCVTPNHPATCEVQQCQRRMRDGCSRISRGGPPVASRPCSGSRVCSRRHARPICKSSAKAPQRRIPPSQTNKRVPFFFWILGPLSVVTFRPEPCDFVTLDFVGGGPQCCCCAGASCLCSPRLGLQMAASAILVPVTGLFAHSTVPSDHIHHHVRGILILVVDLLLSLHASSTLGPSLCAKIKPTLLLVRRWKVALVPLAPLPVAAAGSHYADFCRLQTTPL